MPGQARASATRAPPRRRRVTSSVLAHGSFSTIIIRPGLVVDDRIADHRPGVPRRPWRRRPAWSVGAGIRLDRKLRRRPRRLSTGDGCSMTSADWAYRSCRRCASWPPACSCKQAEVEGVRRRLHAPLERARHAAASGPDRPAPAAILMRSPQIGTLATPATRHQPELDRPVGDHRQLHLSYIVFDVSPIFMTRLVDDSGCRMTGMPADSGRFGDRQLGSAPARADAQSGRRCPA